VQDQGFLAESGGSFLRIECIGRSRWDERVRSGGAQVRGSKRANTSVRVGHRRRSMVIEWTIPLSPRKVLRSP
jgi:hypothetical protein